MYSGAEIYQEISKDNGTSVGMVDVDDSLCEVLRRPKYIFWTNLLKYKSKNNLTLNSPYNESSRQYISSELTIFLS